MSTLHKSNGLAWDEYDAYLFDIDGTLIESTDAVHYFAFCEALTALAGKSMTLDGVVAQGNTDIGIIRDACNLASLPETLWRSQLNTITDKMCNFVEARKNDVSVEVLPGIVPVLEHLRNRGALLGVATGNLARIGRIKLTRANLLQYFRVEGFSDGFEWRPDVIKNAVRQVNSILGQDVRICVVGDTPADVKAARANGLDVIAVATGIFSFDTLAADGPDWCVPNMNSMLS
jgi:phosphoglycolate phosphatase-like HAD superfamily hydrolase